MFIEAEHEGFAREAADIFVLRSIGRAIRRVAAGREQQEKGCNPKGWAASSASRDADERAKSWRRSGRVQGGYWIINISNDHYKWNCLG
jgi:hypothetical protein